MTDNPMLRKLALHYGSPDKADAQRATELIEEYARLTNGYSETELAAAADRVVATHRFRTWPTVAEILAALRAVRSETAGDHGPDRRRDVSYPEWSREAIERADRLIDCDLGREAAKGGWILSLHDFCRRHGRLPTNIEIAPLMASARAVDLFIERTEKERSGPVSAQTFAHGALRRLAEKLIAKRQRLAQRIAP